MNNFLAFYGFMMAGVIFHALLKLSTAYSKQEFAWKVFWKRNCIGWLLGWFAGSVLVVLLSLRNEPDTWMGYALSLFFGYAGSSSLKNLLKAVKGKFTKLFGNLLG